MVLEGGGDQSDSRVFFVITMAVMTMAEMVGVFVAEVVRYS